LFLPDRRPAQPLELESWRKAANQNAGDQSGHHRSEQEISPGRVHA